LQSPSFSAVGDVSDAKRALKTGAFGVGDASHADFAILLMIAPAGLLAVG